MNLYCKINITYIYNGKIILRKTEKRLNVFQEVKNM